MTVAAVVREARQVLRSAGFTDAQSAGDIGVLARAWLGWDLARWLSHQQAPAPAGFRDALSGGVARRATGEPVAYIVGRREFYGRTFQVTPDVLIPRPETELIVDVALARLAARAERTAEPPDLLAVGTGSGCLAITLAIECPAARVVATDISEPALRVAAANAQAHGVGTGMVFEHTALTGGREAAVDLIVSNPPYVAEVDRMSLPADVREFEPAAALFGGPDGLAVIRALLPAAVRALRPGGTILIEIGAGQASPVERLVEPFGLIWEDTRLDLAGTPRVVVARARS
jgi:release factor glutamine methyltransferase